MILQHSLHSTSWMLALCGVLLALAGCVVPGPNGLPVVVLPQVVASPVVVANYGTPAGYYYQNYPVYYYNGRSCYYANGNRYWYSGRYYGNGAYYGNNYSGNRYYGNRYYGNRYYRNGYYGNRY